MQNSQSLVVLILAAGQGTRMKSSLPKVCHLLGGAPLLWHVLSTAQSLKPLQIITVLSPHIPEPINVVENFAKLSKTEISIASQTKQEGTGHAVLSALPHIKSTDCNILVLYGDTPLLTVENLQAMLSDSQASKADVTVLGMRPKDPAKYGRIFINQDGFVSDIIEYKIATPQQLENNLCNSGVMLINGQHARSLLNLISNDNTQGEYLLTDLIMHARNAGLKTSCFEGDATELQGINTRQDLAACEQALQDRWREGAMLNGVTLIDPQTVYFSYDTKIAEDSLIQPNVFFGPGVTIKKNVTILSNSHIEGAVIEEGATIGPFARIRPGTVIENKAKVGNFVEIKKSRLKSGAKVNHLSYIGDAEVGNQTNIGAGTITCNYDGYAKHQTIIGNNASIGANTALIAPIKIGNQAIIGAGSVIVNNVKDNAVALSRVKQTEINGAAHRYRERNKIQNKETKGD